MIAEALGRLLRSRGEETAGRVIRIAVADAALVPDVDVLAAGFTDAFRDYQRCAQPDPARAGSAC